ncbi:hypothetical protein GX586_10260 [bacterium]|nr:hypothetical protein [bacterium]
MFGISLSGKKSKPQDAAATGTCRTPVSAGTTADVEAEVASLKSAVATDPSNRSARAALAELLHETGDLRAAVDTLEPAAVSMPDDDALQLQFLDLLLAAGETEWARRHADFADLRKTGRALRAYVDSVIAAGDVDTPAATPDSAHSAFDAFASFIGEPLFNNDHALRLATLFQGRGDVFARMWVSEDGQTGYSPVSKPYTPRVVLNHLLGNYTTGIYLSRADGTARVMAYDIDIAAPAIDSARGNAQRAAELKAALTEYTCKLSAFLVSCGLAPVIEDSGYKGAHVWVCFNDWRPAGVIRRLGHALLAQITGPSDDISIEVFPKQKGNPVKLGNLIKLPLGIHRKTGRRSVLLDHTGTPCPDQAAALMQISMSKIDLVDPLLDKYNLPEPRGRGQRDQHATSAIVTPAGAPAQSLAPSFMPPMATPEQIDNDAVLAHLLTRCGVLCALVRRIRSSHRMSYEERLVVEHTIGHLPNGPATANCLFRTCENFDSQFYMGRPHRGHPASCAKIRARLPHISEVSDCTCSFEQACANYPTPLNHLYSYVPPTKEPLALPAPASADETVTIETLLKRLETICASSTGISP